MTTEVTTTKTSIRVLKEQDEWASTLLDLARTATDRLVLVSPWLGRAAVLTLLRESAHVPNRQLLVRWPTRDTEAAFVAPQLLRELHRGDHGQIELRFVPSSSPSLLMSPRPVSAWPVTLTPSPWGLSGTVRDCPGLSGQTRTNPDISAAVFDGRRASTILARFLRGSPLVAPPPCPSRPIEPAGYRRRQPEDTELYDAVRGHLRTFLAELDEVDGQGLPGYARQELERFLECGVLAHGFVRVWCPTCRDDMLVAFSCKGRGFCPSCGGRRMADTAARWVDRVLPDVPWRQWVLTVPFDLRIRLAWDTDLVTAVLGVFQRAVACRLRVLARRRGLRGGRHASVTAIQRFGGALNLNLHFHSLVADGVWVEGEEGPRYVPLRVRDEDVVAVTRAVERKVMRLLVQRGLRPSDGDAHAVDVDPDRQLELSLLGASATLRVATGHRAGKLVRRSGVRRRTEQTPMRRKSMQSEYLGFDLHARVRVGRGERRRLEQLCRYLLRPALCVERLLLRPDGLYEYRFRRPWADGTEGVLLSPHELMEKLAALVPIPRANLVRYHGVLAPAAAWRSAVVPPTGEEAPPNQDPPGGRVPPARVPWAQLIARVWLTDVLRCVRCGGQRAVLAGVTDPVAVRAILEHLGLDPEPPLPAPARAPPELDYSWAS